MEGFMLVEMKTGEAFRASRFKSSPIGQSQSRNKKTALAFLRWAQQAGKPIGFWCFGVDYGVEGYARFQKAWDYFARSITGNWVACVEVGKQGKLHLHILMQDYYEIGELKSIFQNIKN